MSADTAERRAIVLAEVARSRAASEAADHRAGLELRQQQALAEAAEVEPTPASTSTDAADRREQLRQQWAVACRVAASPDAFERCLELHGG
jgi:hypothetical protein